MKYQIYSGFCLDVDPVKYGGLIASEWFNKIWSHNTIKYSSGCDINIFGPDMPPFDIDTYTKIRIIAEYDNLGHVGDYLNGSKIGRWCGWTAGVVFGMIHAYVNNTDFIYKEQDCLVFGDYISRMYTDIGNDGDIVFGTCRAMVNAQSLFMVKRNAIPNVIASLAQNDDKDVLPETKFGKLPVNVKKLSFGYDRDRPFNIHDDVFYIQQITPTELDLLTSANLIE